GTAVARAASTTDRAIPPKFGIAERCSVGLDTPGFPATSLSGLANALRSRVRRRWCPTDRFHRSGKAINDKVEFRHRA
ncbi:hypothetical protein JZU69_00465, partial [bacterium]|nr:hypothetical protein [bacterium]